MTDFLEYLEEASNQPISRCFQCKKCSGGCPVSQYSDIKAHQVVRMAQLGLEQQLTASPGIWYCVGCKTCKLRCPNGIDISAILDVVKGKILAAGTAPGADIPAFHTSFLASVKRHGRVYELGMVVGYKWRVKKWTEDKELGIRMFAKGKLPVLPHRIQGRRQLREIFNLEAKGGRADD
ncbi:MAG TPA: 4Fe-4S dicluster domain-containing protein [Verrucomicrobiae bacterium]|nr:4Fe-4S dicluster domain-containing protein [Verrucomicrobiae bacterium]